MNNIYTGDVTTASLFCLTIWKDVKTQGYQTGDGKTPIHYCINSITERYSAITHYVGKRLEAEKAARGGNHGNQYTKMAKEQNEPLANSGDTASRIANEIGKSRDYVKRAEKFAKGLDAASAI